MLKLQIAFGSWPWVTAGLLITQNQTYIWTPLIIIIIIDFEFFSYNTAAADVGIQPPVEIGSCSTKMCYF